MKNPVVTIKMKSDKLIKLELFPDKAPNTVNNFIYLVKKGFYNGLIFHRVIENFMIQGGDPKGQGIGGPGYSVKGEFANNGVENDLNHTAGVISMARSQHMDSAGSQFFIMHRDAPHLDGSYAAFGKVIEGMDEVDRIAKTETDFRDKPLKEEKMLSLVVETFGIDYPEPERISD
jgi:peptidyl-prolyl cis-trans isomerase B (cyclophilin B)